MQHYKYLTRLKWSVWVGWAELAVRAVRAGWAVQALWAVRAVSAVSLISTVFTSFTSASSGRNSTKNHCFKHTGPQPLHIACIRLAAMEVLLIWLMLAYIKPVKRGISKIKTSTLSPYPFKRLERLILKLQNQYMSFTIQGVVGRPVWVDFSGN